MSESILRVFKKKHPEYKDLTLADFNTVVKNSMKTLLKKLLAAGME